MLKNSPTGNKRSQVVADLSTINLADVKVRNLESKYKSTQKTRPNTALARKFNNTTILKETELKKPEVRQITLIKKKVNVKGKKKI